MRGQQTQERRSLCDEIEIEIELRVVTIISHDLVSLKSKLLDEQSEELLSSQTKIHLLHPETQIFSCSLLTSKIARTCFSDRNISRKWLSYIFMSSLVGFSRNSQVIFSFLIKSENHLLDR